MLTKAVFILVVCTLALVLAQVPTCDDAKVCTCPAGYSYCSGKCTAMLVKLGGACKADSECREKPNAKCTGGMCQCTTYFVSDIYNSTCNLIKLKLEEKCPPATLGNACVLSEHASCNSSSLCACVDGYKPDSNKTQCALDPKNLNDTCFIALQCPTNAACAAGKCKCLTGYRESSGQCVLIQSTLYQECKILINCPGAHQTCNTTNCICMPGYVANADLNGCDLYQRNLGQFCHIDDQCQASTSGIPTECFDDSPGHKVDGTPYTTQCECGAYNKRISGPDCKLTVVGESCEFEFDCPKWSSCLMIVDSVGVPKPICECWPGYKRNEDSTACVVDTRKIGDTCIKSLQCINGAATQNFSSCSTAGLCVCWPGYMAPSTMMSCDLQPRNIGEQCDATVQCPEHASCDASGICLCNTYYKSNTAMSACEPQMLFLHFACDNSIQCAVKGSFCDSVCTKQCQCHAGLVEIDGSCVRPMIGDMCARGLMGGDDENVHCPGNGTCADVDTYLDRCICMHGYSTNDNVTCLASLDSPCAKDTDCSFLSNAQCGVDADGVYEMSCECQVGFMFDPTTATCTSGFVVLSAALIPTFLAVLLAAF